MAADKNVEQKPTTSLLEGISLFLRNTIGIGIDLIKLVLLETEIASKNIIKIIGICLAISLLIFTLWLLLQAVISIWLINMGYSWTTALLSLIAINVLSIFGMACLLKSCGKHVMFVSTRKQLKNLSEQPLVE